MSELSRIQVPGFPPATVSAEPAALRARVSREIAPGDRLAEVEVAARSAASAVTPGMAGVLLTRPSAPKDTVTISAAARAAALRAGVDARSQSAAVDELERALDVETLDPEFRYGGPRGLEAGFKGQISARPHANSPGRLTHTVDVLA